MNYPENISIGISPCPNDIFIFGALLENKIKIPDIILNFHILDIEELNQACIQEKFDISKISFVLYPKISEKYVLLDSGSALGNNNGPLLVAREKPDTHSLSTKKVLIPGKHTTANFLLSVLFPEITNKKEVLFSEIEDHVNLEKAELGLIIHESRFTYAKKGLIKVADLGEIWEKKFHLPIPLGGITAKRDMDTQLLSLIDKALKESIHFAYQNKHWIFELAGKYAQNTAKDVIEKHIALYVNKYSLSLGKKGRNALRKMFSIGEERMLFQAIAHEIFHLA